MTDPNTLLAAYDERTRARIPRTPSAGVTFERDGALLRTVGMQLGFVETPQDAGVRGAELDALIRRQRDFFAARGEGVEWKTRGHDEPADLPARLLAAGFEAEDTETVLIGSARSVAEVTGVGAGANAGTDTGADGSGGGSSGSSSSTEKLPDGVTIREVREYADLRRIGAQKSEVWGRDRTAVADDLAARLAGAPDTIGGFVAEAAGQVVSSAWIEFEPGTGFAGLWGGATLEAWRGRGIYRALVARRVRLAVARGYEYVQVDASEDSRPILQRLGLTAVTTTTPYVWTP